MVEPIPLRRPADPPAPAGHEPELAQALAWNLKRLRSRNGLSLEAVAKAAGLSTATLRQVERGELDADINLVWKIARAFDVPFSALMAAAPRPRTRVLPASRTPALASDSGAFTSRMLVPFAPDRGVEFYELRFRPQAVEDAAPHRAGTLETLTVVRGRLAVEVDGEVHELGDGDSIQFAADRPHGYRSLSDAETQAFLVMTYGEAAEAAAEA